MLNILYHICEVKSPDEVNLSTFKIGTLSAGQWTGHVGDNVSYYDVILMPSFALTFGMLT